MCGQRSYNHLSHTRAAERLGADELLVLDSGQEVAQRGGSQDDGFRDEGRGPRDDAEPLDESHDAVRGGAHVVGRDFAHVAIESARSRADAQQQRDLDEDDDEGRRAVLVPGQHLSMYSKSIAGVCEASSSPFARDRCDAVEAIAKPSRGRGSTQKM